MKKCLIRMAITPIGMVLCIIAGFAAWSLWHGNTGREYVPQGIIAMIFILLLAVVLRRAARWRVADFILGLLVAEVITLIVISHFSGFTWGEIFEPFNLGWLLSISAFIAPSWILGFGLGSFWRWYWEKYAKRVA